MAWQYLAAAAPYILGALQPKPDMPKYVAPQTYDLSQYNRQLLNAAFNPNSNQYRMASDVVQEQVSRALARSGMAGSSVGAQMGLNAQNQLAQSYMDNLLQRGTGAIGAVNAQNQSQLSAADAAYKRAMDMYNAQMGNAQGAAQGLGAMTNTMMGIYGNQQTMDAREADRAMMADIYRGNQAPTYTPSYAPMYGTPGQYNPSFSYNSPNYGGIGT